MTGRYRLFRVDSGGKPYKIPMSLTGVTEESAFAKALEMGAACSVEVWRGAVRLRVFPKAKG
jgi:hypothetical protein